jgi:hypothetical protein
LHNPPPIEAEQKIQDGTSSRSLRHPSSLSGQTARLWEFPAPENPLIAATFSGPNNGKFGHRKKLEKTLAFIVLL